MDYNESNCTASIQFNRRLAKIVDSELKQVNEPHHKMLRHATGYLYLTGFLDTTTCLIASGHVSNRERRQFLADRRNVAIERLRDANIIPPSPVWLSIAWFVFRWVIVPFIQNLLDRYSDTETM